MSKCPTCEFTAFEASSNIPYQNSKYCLNKVKIYFKCLLFSIALKKLASKRFSQLYIVLNDLSMINMAFFAPDSVPAVIEDILMVDLMDLENEHSSV